MSKKKKKTVELSQMNVILKIPEKAAALEIRASMLDEDGKPITVMQKLSVQDIFLARRDFLDNVEFGDDYDARFVLTDEGRAHLAGLAEEQGSD